MLEIEFRWGFGVEGAVLKDLIQTCSKLPKLDQIGLRLVSNPEEAPKLTSQGLISVAKEIRGLKDKLKKFSLHMETVPDISMLAKYAVTNELCEIKDMEEVKLNFGDFVIQSISPSTHTPTLKSALNGIKTQGWNNGEIKKDQEDPEY